MSDAPPDTQLDRRAFLARVAAASAVAAGGANGRARGGRPHVVRGAGARRFDDLTELTLAQTATAIRRGRSPARSWCGRTSSGSRRFEGTYLAFNTVLAAAGARAGARARSAASRPACCTASRSWSRTTTGRRASRPRPTRTSSRASSPTRTRRASRGCCGRGAVLLGKTQMGPLATTRATTPDGVVTTVNAWTPNTPSYDPGGSSSGSATAVAGRLACSSIGTQTGRLDHEPVQPAGPDRPEADDGPDVALRRSSR